jgi:hypothetical protein
VKGNSVRDADFFNFTQPGPYPEEDQGSIKVFIKMGITKLSSPYPPAKDYYKERMQMAKSVKVPTRPAALKVQVGWKMIEISPLMRSVHAVRTTSTC